MSKDVSEQTKWYLEKLRRQYKTANEIFFCNDFAVDSVLWEFVLECHRRNIHTDISFYEYDRKKADPEDVAAILSRMLDLVLRVQKDAGTGKRGKGEEKVRVQGAVVKNQLIFSVTFTAVENTILPGIKIRKKDFNPWIKRYDGLIQLIQNNNSIQIIVGLNE